MKKSKLIEKLKELTPEQQVKTALFAAELVLPVFEAVYPDDQRPRRALEAATNAALAAAKANAVFADDPAATLTADTTLTVAAAADTAAVAAAAALAAIDTAVFAVTDTAAVFAAADDVAAAADTADTAAVVAAAFAVVAAADTAAVATNAAFAFAGATAAAADVVIIPDAAWRIITAAGRDFNPVYAVKSSIEAGLKKKTIKAFIKRLLKSEKPRMLKRSEIESLETDLKESYKAFAFKVREEETK